MMPSQTNLFIYVVTFLAGLLVSAAIIYLSKNRQRKYPEKGTGEEKLLWLKASKPWCTLDSKVLDLMVQKLEESNHLNKFINYAVKENLICAIKSKVVANVLENKFIISLKVSETLLKRAKVLLGRLSNVLIKKSNQSNEFKSLYQNILDMCEGALLFDKYCIEAYQVIAIIHTMADQPVLCLNAAKEGLQNLHEIKSKPECLKMYTDSHFITDQDVLNLESMLLKIIKDNEEFAQNLAANDK